MDLTTRTYLKKRFQQYYWRHSVPAPPEIYRREFGHGTLDDKIKFRHKALASQRDLDNFLRREAPFFVSYSVAYYEFPANQPMSSKGWLGADLTFDLDRPIPNLSHAELDAVREEALRLREFLTDDFGFAEKDVRVNFSGSKGYHLHVFDPQVQGLTGEQRRQIIGYIAGDVDFASFLRAEGEVITGPGAGDVGWAGRIYRELRRFLADSDEKTMRQVPGIGPKRSAELVANRQRLLLALESGEYQRMPEIVSIKVGSHGRTGDPNVRAYYIKEVHSPLINRIIRERAVTVTDSDRQVTVDTSRLIRLPDSIHGGTGLLAATAQRLEDFDPLRDALAFQGDEIEVETTDEVAAFEMNDQTFGPLTPGRKARLPEYAAMYLLLKDKARMTGGEIAEDTAEEEGERRNEEDRGGAVLG